MHKFDCRDCGCLCSENGDKSDKWFCDELDKPCSEIDNCPEGIDGIAIGDEVMWEDPDDGISSGVYKVFGIPNDEVLQLSNGTSEVEVYWDECK